MVIITLYILFTNQKTTLIKNYDSYHDSVLGIFANKMKEDNSFPHLFIVLHYEPTNLFKHHALYSSLIQA